MSENGWAEGWAAFAVPLADGSMVAVDVLPCASITLHRLDGVIGHDTLGRVWPGGLLASLEPIRLEAQDAL
jgi:hypothetical protein